MLSRFFNYDNPVWRFVMKIGMIWLLDMIWLAASLPVITIGASTTALFYSCMKLQKDDGYPLQNFLHSFRENFLQSTVIWLIYAAVGVLLGGGLIFWNQKDQSSMKLPWVIVWGLLVLYILSLLYVFAVQSRFVNKVKDTIHYSLILAVKHFRETFQMLIILAALVYVNTSTIFLANFLTLTIGVGLTAYLFSIYFESVFQRYMPKEEPQEEISGEEKEE